MYVSIIEKDKIADQIEDISRERRGFTLIELIVVIAIIGMLAAITVPAVSGTVGGANASRREGDLKAVLDANERFASHAGSDAVSGSPTVTVEDTDDDGIIVIKIDTQDPNTFAFNELIADVTCCDGDLSSDFVVDALEECFGSVDFSLLVPDSLTIEPSHAGEFIAVTTSGSIDAVADLTITNVNRAGDTLEIHLDEDIEEADGLAAWSVSDEVLLLIDEADY